MATFGERIKFLRTERGMSGEELGLVFGKTRSGISSWESRNRNCDQDMLKRLSTYFNCSVDFLVGKTDERNPVVSTETKSFAVKLVQQLIDENIITDPNNISSEITDMILAALRTDLKANKKD